MMEVISEIGDDKNCAAFDDSINTAPPVHSEDGDAVCEESTVEVDGGLELNIVEDDEVEERHSANWLIVFAAFILLGCNSLLSTLHGSTLQFLNQESDLSSLYTGQPALGNAYLKENEPQISYEYGYTGNSYQEADHEQSAAEHRRPRSMEDIGKEYPSRKTQLSSSKGLTSAGFKDGDAIASHQHRIKRNSFPSHGTQSSGAGSSQSFTSPSSSNPLPIAKPTVGNFPSSGWSWDQKEQIHRKMELEFLLQDLQYRYFVGDKSLAANITSILYALNRSSETVIFLSDTDVGNVDVDADLWSRNLYPNISQWSDIVSDPPSQPVADTHEAVFGLFGIVSATLILLFGYRSVAFIGSIIIGFSCLGSAFSNKSNTHLISFLYGAMPGLGQNMVVVSSTVAVLEHYKKRRLVALLIPHIGRVISVMAMTALSIWVFPAVRINSWKSYLLLQTGVAGVMVFASFFLKPLNLRMRGSGNVTLLSRLFGIGKLNIYCNICLYAYAALVYFWESGNAIIMAKLPSLKGLDLIPFFSTGAMLVVLLMATSLIGMCISCCMPRDLKLRSTLIIVAVFCCISSLLSLFVALLYDPFYAIVYSGIIGILKGVTDPLMEYIIPLLLGEEYIAVGTGVMTMSQALGAMTMVTLADKIEMDMKEVDGCFYLTGILFFISFLFTFWSCRLSRHAEDVNKQSAPASGPSSPGSGEPCKSSLRSSGDLPKDDLPKDSASSEYIV